MTLHHRHFSLIRAGVLATVLTAGGALVAYAALPAASDGGQAHAAAKADNGAQGTSHVQGTDPVDGTANATEKLADNWTRLSGHLEDVIARLQNGNAADAAVNAVQNALDRLGGDIGLNKATDAVNGNVPAPDLPDQATSHPGQP